MDDILVHDEAEIAANRAGGSFCRISGAHNGTHLATAPSPDTTIFTTGPLVM